MYEIPNQLQYKERIVFNLTFEQLVYAIIFAIPIILLVRSSFSIFVKIILSIVLASIATSFMYFDLLTILKSGYTWLKLRKIDNNKFENYIGIEKIEDNLVHFKNKSVAVLKIEPINFSIKPEKEKETISLAFQKLLNSIEEPIQIVMTTENLDMQDYLKALRKNSNKVTKKYEDGLLEEMNKREVFNRIFYIVVPGGKDISTRLQVLEERLRSIGLKTTKVKNHELLEITSKIKFPEREIVDDKGFKGRIERLYDYFSNQENNVDYLKIGEEYLRTIYAYGYPRTVETGFIDKIVSSLGDFDLSLHIEPNTVENTFIQLNRELQKQRADLYAAKLKNQLNPSLEIKYADTRKTLEHLQKGDEKLFNLSLYVTCKAKSKEHLDFLTKKVESELNSLLIIPKKSNFEMLQGLVSCLPILRNELKIKRNMPTKALSAFFPFTSSFFSFDKEGVWLGINKNNIPIIKDIFSLSNPNGVVLSQSGGGKSYFCKLLVSRYLVNGTRVMVIDPQGEYNSLVSACKGQRIELSKDSETIINPMDLMGHSYIEKRLSLMDLMKIMLGDLSDIQKAFLDKAINIAYKKKGITEREDTWNNQPPILGDLHKALRSLEKSVSRLEKTTINSLANRLDMYVGGVFGFMNRKTNIDFDNKFVSFDIGNLPSQVKPSIMFLVLDYIYMKMRSNKEKKILLIDEAWSLLSRAEDAGHIFEIVKTCRKFNLGLLLINQEVEGLLESRAGKSVLANSAYTLLLKQKPAVIEAIRKTFYLSEKERAHLLTANIGEGLLIMEDDHSEIKVIATPEEHKLITTNPNEVKSKVYPTGKGKNVSINIDLNRRFFRYSELSKEEIKFLIDDDYKIIKHKSLVSGKRETFLIKPRHKESETHIFATHDLSDYLISKGFKPKLYASKKPDIVFKKRGKLCALEIETGTVLEKAPNQLREKVEMLNKNYDSWFFVVTNRNKVSKYRKYGPTLDFKYIRRQIDKFLKE
jgi:conjugal transfer ATP-binding protein TraC